MKLLQRLRSMGPGVEPPAGREHAEALPGLNRDDFLDPPAEEAFEPILGAPGTPREQSRDTDHPQR
jgi:hypothetical protein